MVCAMTRARISVAPPGAAGAMKVMGRRGQGAWAKAGLASSAGDRIRLRRVVFIWFSFGLQPEASA